MSIAGLLALAAILGIDAWLLKHNIKLQREFPGNEAGDAV